MNDYVQSKQTNANFREKSIFHNAIFTVLWLSEVISLIGDRILMVALIAFVYRLTQSASSVSLLPMIKALPALFLATFAGVFVDRWSHKWTMVFSNLLQGLMVILIPLTNLLPVVFMVYLGMAIVNQFFAPARSATIPDLVPRESLVSANAIFAAGIVAAIVIGPALGGWMSERYGLKAAFYADAFSFFVPAVAVGCLAIPQTKRSLNHQTLASAWREGLSMLRNSRDIQLALILIGAAIAQISSLTVLGIIILDERLGLGAGGLGALMSLMGVGMLAGMVSQRTLKTKFSRIQLASGGVVLAGIGISILPWMSSLPLCMACAWLLGVGFVTVQANTQTVLQSAPENLRGRALSMGQAVTGSISFLAAALIGLLAGKIGAQAALLVSGLTACAGGMAIIWFHRPRSTYARTAN